MFLLLESVRLKSGLFGVFALLSVTCVAQETDLRKAVEDSLRKGVSYFYSINSHGGYGYYVLPDLSQRWGEGQLDPDTVEVQPPGTPAVGQSFLRVYQITGDPEALRAAKAAAYCLIQGQNSLGGWEHTINFTKLGGDTVSFDDDQTQSAISFLMALDQEVDDSRISEGVDRAIALMLESQLENGGWPHKYPEQGNYHDYATFNDEGINDCIRVMIEAHRFYGGETIDKSLLKVARFLMISQLPPPQPGWAQQYNEYLQPAWARSFEPPSVCPSVTIKNIDSLIDLYLALGNADYLEPIPDALRWLREIRLENGKWARFVEIGTNKSLYYDRGRIRVDTLEELHPERRFGYGYETDLSGRLEASEERYRKALELGRNGLMEAENDPAQSEKALEERMRAVAKSAKEIIDAQEPSGAWITRNDRFKKRMPRGERWNGQYEVMDRIGSQVFNRNIAALCDYLELYSMLNE